MEAGLDDVDEVMDRLLCLRVEDVCEVMGEWVDNINASNIPNDAKWAAKETVCERFNAAIARRDAKTATIH